MPEHNSNESSTEDRGGPSRRRFLRTGTVVGTAWLLPRPVARAAASPSLDLAKFVQPLPIPEVKDPDGRRRGQEYYEVSVTEFEQRLHPDLPPTTLWGYDKQFPGPIIQGWRNRRLSVRFDNSDLPTDHLLEVDDRINGTEPGDYPGYDGPVPEVRTVTHFHGLNVPPTEDGQADMWKSPDGVTGPRYSDDVHELSNRQPRMSSTYHDHALGISRLNNYAGLVGAYYIRSQQEQRLGLPDDEYDLPLILTDRSFNADGSLHYPDSFMPNVAGDTAVVNGAVWPYLEVEPRRYRFRILNPSNGRTYDLRIESGDHGDGHGGHGPSMYQIAAGHGFLDRVVEIGHDGDVESLLVAPFERADVIVDFSGHEGESFVLTNDAAFPFVGGSGGHGGHGGHGGSSPDLTELLQFRVENTAIDDESTRPSALDLPQSGPPLHEERAVETRQMEMSMTRDEFGLPKHLLNGSGFFDEVVIEPQLGTTEVWELRNDTMHTHPIHLHLVQFRVLGRGPDGTDDPDPTELGGKDVVRVNPDETVRIAVTFGDFTGRFPWHCHILEHEDHEMMRPFEVVTGEENDNARGNGNGGGN